MKTSSIDIQALKESVDIHALLTSLGFKIDKENSKEIRCACIIHGGDNTSAFKFNKEKRTWTCFTHRCQDDYGYDIIGLIRGALDTDFKGALDYLRNLVGDVELNTHLVAERKFNADRDNFIKTYAKPKKPEYVTEDHLRTYRPLRSQHFKHKGDFSKKTLDYFEVAGGFTDEFGILRDIVPIRDVNGALDAYSLRDVRLNPPDESFKYILTEGFVKDKSLYNLHKAKVFGTLFPLVVVEGFKSVWRLYDYGIYNVVCAMGSFISDGQVELLRTYANKGVVVMFDQDNPGRLGNKLAGKNLTTAGIPNTTIDISAEDIDDGEGPAEFTLEQAYRYLNGYIG